MPRCLFYVRLSHQPGSYNLFNFSFGFVTFRSFRCRILPISYSSPAMRTPLFLVDLSPSLLLLLRTINRIHLRFSSEVLMRHLVSAALLLPAQPAPQAFSDSHSPSLAFLVFYTHQSVLKQLTSVLLQICR